MAVVPPAQAPESLRVAEAQPCRTASPGNAHRCQRRESVRTHSACLFPKIFLDISFLPLQPKFLLGPFALRVAITFLVFLIPIFLLAGSIKTLLSKSSLLVDSNHVTAFFNPATVSVSLSSLNSPCSYLQSPARFFPSLVF